ncbi:hypothetical protein GH714_040204 [Hevea brasiliensis]|uniref:E3 ubiquitin ligase BIG BROTHER-related n=1 Tax=Hevea brasiliensis TaxID=3981 RepID=A0A6A6LRE0_HEVBR|nr:hypothetical protein GH714_040204 [Hevea brasiliensis]
MENNVKLGSGEAKSIANNNGSSREQEQEREHNLNLGFANDNGDQEEPQPPRHSSRRTPFTNLSQERAYMMLRLNNDGSDYGSWEAGSYLHDDEDDFGDPTDDNEGVEEDEDEDDDGTDADDGMDAFDVHAHADAGADNVPGVDLDPSMFSSDEAYARALQDAEEREMAARLLALAGIDDREVEDTEDHGGNSQVEVMGLVPLVPCTSDAPLTTMILQEFFLRELSELVIYRDGAQIDGHHTNQ